ncbi:hypothetical protein IQ269_16925 [Tychonema sp. LEGE 07199]|uniref:hypothetical protein n=1 Tax=unclassified Tychonema TaxID=2642144 RepID=UPI00187F767F|nr:MULTISPECIES: hypothetical protein [unclassified Tychonema]MBE9122436.1 hypothetical protein [Tychonema sp. LEGE 07199]MBE9135384.1 hypothetical protein [Tychonema sp. LEGE 07196]
MQLIQYKVAMEPVPERKLEGFLALGFRLAIDLASGALFVPIAIVRSQIAKLHLPKQDSLPKRSD